MGGMGGAHVKDAQANQVPRMWSVGNLDQEVTPTPTRGRAMSADLAAQIAKYQAADCQRLLYKSERDEARADLAAARRVIEPFAEAARWYDRDYCTGDVVLWQSRYGISVSLKVDHLWAARAFLDGLEAPSPTPETSATPALPSVPAVPAVRPRS
jgi:hypothetical protein